LSKKSGYGVKYQSLSKILGSEEIYKGLK